MIGYAELGCMSNFSFLEGASHPAQLVEQAASLGLAALGIADRNTLAGVVRAHKAAKDAGLRLLIGCRLEFLDGTELIVFPRDRAAYGRLCRLLSEGKTEALPKVSNVVPLPFRGGARDAAGGQGVGPAGNCNGAQLHQLPHPPTPSPEGEGEQERITKGDTRLTFDHARRLGDGMIALVPAPARLDAGFAARLAAWAIAWPDALYLAAAPRARGDDRARLARLARLAAQAGAPLVASNAVLYHHPDQRRLQDVLTCIREGVHRGRTAGFRLNANAERHLKSPDEMARLFRGHDAGRDRAHHRDHGGLQPSTLDELKYEYPAEPVPEGRSATAASWSRLVLSAHVRERYPRRCAAPRSRGCHGEGAAR